MNKPPKPMTPKQRFTRVYEERIQALLSDHYCKRFEHRSATLWLCKLKNMANGNEIVIKAYPIERYLEQRTNGIIRHSEVIQ